MATEWEKLKEALKKAPTPEAMAEAARAFAQYRVARGAEASKPMLVNLGRATGYPNAIPLDEIPNQLTTNPEFFKLMKKVVR